jgi:hypothetical protein
MRLTLAWALVVAVGACRSSLPSLAHHRVDSSDILIYLDSGQQDVGLLCMRPRQDRLEAESECTQNETSSEAIPDAVYRLTKLPSSASLCLTSLKTLSSATQRTNVLSNLQ